MFYDYDDYFNEPTEFDMQVEEFKESLRNSVKDEIKNRIESLEKELAELREFKEDRHKLIRECEVKITEAQREVSAVKRAAKESEDKWKKARLHQLLGDYLTVGWKPGYKWEYGEKCDKCDDNRKIHFTSPQGRKYEEECKCATRYFNYFPQEVTLCKFYVQKKNFGYGDNGKADFYNRYYIVAENDSEYDRYESANYVYTSSDINYEDVKSSYAVFLNEEDCKKYCDWKTELERKKKSAKK